MTILDKRDVCSQIQSDQSVGALLPLLLYFALWACASGCGSTAATQPPEKISDRQVREPERDQQAQPTSSEAERRAAEDHYRRVMENARRRHYEVIWINRPRRIPVKSTK